MRRRRRSSIPFGFRRPSLRKRIAARTSWKRYLRHSFGLKMPRGWGWVSNPRRTLYNRIYSRTTRQTCLVTVLLGGSIFSLAFGIIWALVG